MSGTEQPAGSQVLRRKTRRITPQEDVGADRNEGGEEKAETCCLVCEKEECVCPSAVKYASKKGRTTLRRRVGSRSSFGYM